MKEQTKQIIYSILLGCAGGIVMAAFLLFAMNTVFYTILFPSFLSVCVAAMGFPFCVGIFRGKGYSILLIQAVMILVSLGICIAYAVYVTSFNPYYSGSLLESMLVQMPLLIHSLSALTVIAVSLFRRIRTEHR